jgi:hypothetical protein
MPLGSLPILSILEGWLCLLARYAGCLSKPARYAGWLVMLADSVGLHSSLDG